MPLSQPDLFRLFDASPNPYLVLDRQLNIATANRAYLASVQRELEDIVGRWAWEAFPTDEATLRQAVASFERVIRTGQPDIMPLLRFDVPRPPEQGGGVQKRYWSITHTPVFDDAGEVVLVLQNPIDVTSLEELRETVGSSAQSATLLDQTGLFRRAEEVSATNRVLAEQVEQNAAAMNAVAEDRRQLTQLFDQSPSFLGLLVGPEHRIEFVNQKYLELVGQREVLGRAFADTLTDAVEQGYLEILDGVYATGKAYRANGARYLVRPDPAGPATERFVDFVFQPLRGNDGEVTGIIVDGVDVTRRVQEQQRADALERITQVIRAARDPVALSFGAAEIVGKLLGASRVGYSPFDADTDRLHTERDWTAPGVPSIAGFVRVRDFGSWSDDMKQGNIVVVGDVRLDPRTLDGAALERLDARSFLNVPIMEDDKLVAMFFVNKAQAHEWQDAEIAFVREVAERTRTATERLSTENARQRIADELRALNTTLERRIEERSAALRLYQNIVRSDAKPIAAFDTSYRLVAFNPAQQEEFKSTHGQTLELGQVFPDLLPEPQSSQLRAHMKRALGGDVFSTVMGSDSTENAHWWELSYNPLRDDTNAIIGAVHHATDITERRRAQAELASAHASLLVSRDAAHMATRAKSAFLANMSHEIRTPLNAVLGLTHLLMRDPRDADDRARLQKIADAAQHLLRIINNLLDLSKVESGKMELAEDDFSFQTLLDQAREMVAVDARAKGLALHVSSDGVPAWLRGDRTRLSQVLINLLGNAVKFTDHGSVSLAASVQQRQGGRIELAIEVADTGPGVPLAHRPSLFQPFSQADSSAARQHGGTGLGLAVSRQIAHSMGGDISLRQSGAAGSTFLFTAWLACAAGEVGPAAEAIAEGVRDAEVAWQESEAALRRLHAGRRVLVAEDNPVNAEIAVDLLGGVGLRVDLAIHGAMAVEMALATSYDLILMDMQMPLLDGLSAARKIRQHSAAGTPIIAMTANAFASDRVACLDAGMNGHLAKPVDPGALYATMLEWLPKEEAVVRPPAAESEAAAVPGGSLAQRLSGVRWLDVDRGLRNTGGKPLFYERVLRNFAELYRGGMPDRGQLLIGDAHDEARVKAAFHSLRGALDTIGAARLADSIASRDQVASHASTAALATAVVKADAELAAFAQSVARAIGPPATPPAG